MSEQEQISGTALRPTDVVTEDMKLPAGSAVIQAILHRDADDPKLVSIDFRFVTIGTTQLKLANPTHRFLQAVQRRMDEIMAEVTGGIEVGFTATDDDVIEARLRGVQPGIEAAAKSAIHEGLIAGGKTPEEADALIAEIVKAHATEQALPIDAEASPLVAQARAAAAAPSSSDPE
jgi:hypothetical protein